LKISTASLKILAISIEDLDSLWLAHIATRYPDLVELQLTVTSNPQSFSVSEWQNGFLAIADRCTKLEKLYCQSNNEKGAFHPTKMFSDRFSQTTNCRLKSLTKHCPNIKSFTLKDATILQETCNNDRYQSIQLTYICLYSVENANVFINAISQYVPKLRHISITEHNTFDPSEYRLYLSNNTIHYLDIEWIVWERVYLTDPFYFKLSQTPIPGERPTIHAFTGECH
jgi:hypothetical protein